MASGQQVYTSFSCQLCKNVDVPEMVQCDFCNKWYHFDCVGVTSDVADRDWICERCNLWKDEIRDFDEKKRQRSSESQSLVPDPFSYESSKVSTRVSRLSVRQKATALKKLEEEQKIKLDILKRKYQILDDASCEFVDEIHDDGKRASMDYTLQWSKKVQDVSKNFAKMSFLDNISISLSDRDREVVNKFSVNELKENFPTSKVAKTIRFEKKSDDIIRQSVLSSKVVPEHQQPGHLSSNAGQSELKIDSTVERGTKGLQFDNWGDRKRNYQGLSERFGRLRMQSQPEAEFVPTFQRSVENDLSQKRNPERQQRQSGNRFGSSDALQVNFAKQNKERNEREVKFNIDPRSSHQVRCSTTNVNLGTESTPVHGSARVDDNSFRNSPNNSTYQGNAIPVITQQIQSSNPGPAQSNSGCQGQILKSGYVSNTSGTLTKTQIASRHVFKDLPEFHGRAKEWLMYLSSLKNSTNACGYTDSENLGRLQKSLKGEAKTLVASRLVHASSVPGVVETLHLIFGRPSVIIQELLDRHHYVTQLIVNYYHRKYKHLHHQTVLNEVKQKFWIPKLRVLLGTIRNNCQKCKNTAAVPRVPEMAPLPRARLATHMRPFTFFGIDYFGPIPVVFGRGTVKRWGVLITCLTTRAIHLEVAHSLDTSSCIMAINRFVVNRGQPKEFFSDNGTNFHGADNTLKEEFKKLDKNRIQEEFTTSEYSWSFNPPAAPHMGGSWERMIRTVKNCLEESMTSRFPTDEVLLTLFAEAENIVNSRPLTYVSLDSPEDEILTPNHFLVGSSNGHKPVGDFTSSDLLKNSWRTAQAMADKFWNAFVLEYLPTIMKRTKWYKEVEPVKVDGVVLIVDENFKRNTWPKGIVAEVFKDTHGQVVTVVKNYTHSIS